MSTSHPVNLRLRRQLDCTVVVPWTTLSWPSSKVAEEVTCEGATGACARARSVCACADTSCRLPAPRRGASKGSPALDPCAPGLLWTPGSTPPRRGAARVHTCYRSVWPTLSRAVASAPPRMGATGARTRMRQVKHYFCGKTSNLMP